MKNLTVTNLEFRCGVSLSVPKGLLKKQFNIRKFVILEKQLKTRLLVGALDGGLVRAVCWLSMWIVVSLKRKEPL